MADDAVCQGTGPLLSMENSDNHNMQVEKSSPSNIDTKKKESKEYVPHHSFQDLLERVYSSR